ncbi:hypothetical protein G6F24_018464 [Rhizopus arrhizus]|nr:hypothetical protein G6F24_018464 [Rhizopus arrhizus]
MTPTAAAPSRSSARSDAAEKEAKKGKGKSRAGVAEEGADYRSLSPAQLATRLKALEQQMYQHAKDLEFGDAARVRAPIRRLKEARLG